VETGAEGAIIERAVHVLRPAGEITATARAAVNATFAHVTLGGGVGLREAAAIDDYASHDVLAARRAEDEKDDWSAITVEDVDLHSASPAFFDAEAMRFHLPAYMIADLDGCYRHEFVPHLRGRPEKFALLNDAQRRAVELYLHALLQRNYPPSYQTDVEQALGEWRQAADR